MHATRFVLDGLSTKLVNMNSNKPGTSQWGYGLVVKQFFSIEEGLSAALL